MDAANHFETKATYLHARLEYGTALAVCAGLLLVHRAEVNWLNVLILLSYIDLIGYLPGAVAYRLSRDGSISRVYYVMYNIMHSFISGLAVAAVWTYFFGAEWALLAIPIHLCADRSIFGNFPKAYALSFEPRRHPVYARFAAEFVKEVADGRPQYRRRAGAAR